MKIDHINIVVTDLKKAVDFFFLLGFQIKNQGKLQGKWIDEVVNLKNVQAEYVALSLPGKETNLELLCFVQPQGTIDPDLGKANQIGLRHLAIEVEDIETVVQKLKIKGIKFFSPIQKYGDSKKLCYFKGPEGVILELCDYRKEV